MSSTVSTMPAAWAALRTAKLDPAVGTVIKGEGKVVFHDVSRCDLHRMCVETAGKYPDVEIWTEVLKDKDIRGVRYTEKETCGAFLGYLWFYFKAA